MPDVNSETRKLSLLLGPATAQDRQELIEKVRSLDEPLCLHAELVSNAVEQVARTLGLARDDRSALIDAAWLHDIGKLTVSTAILDKPGPLDGDEWTEMQQHPVRGADFLALAPAFTLVAPMVRHHHERFDGSGYPLGLAGANIPLGSRIISVVDAYDAMTTERPYRRAMKLTAALEEIQRCAGTQFDPQIVTAFNSIAPLLRKGSNG